MGPLLALLTALATASPEIFKQVAALLGPGVPTQEELKAASAYIDELIAQEMAKA